MEDSRQNEMKLKFDTATESFVNKVKDDPNVIAIIVCGSLAYDVVWEKSDIDMTLIVRDQSLKNESYCIIEDGIVINVHVVIRSGFKRYLEGVIGGSFMQSYFAKGRILYTTDESLYEYLEDIKRVGKDDSALTVFHTAAELVYLYNKSLKWLTVKKNPLYAQYYVLKAAEVIARIEVCKEGEPPTREAILKVMKENPDVLASYYQNAMSHHYSEAELISAIDGIDRYLEQQMDIIMLPVIEFMSDQEIKTITLLCKRFRTESHYIEGIFEYLADKGAIERVAQTIRITPKSKLSVEELGYLYLP